MIRFLLPLCLAAAPIGLALADTVSIRSDVLKETTVQTPDGPKTVQKPATRATPGDLIIIRLAYTNAGAKPANDVVISNPMPSGLTFVEARAAGAQVSVDGGKTFGLLTQLSVKEGDGTRAAKASDVTHIRWRVAKPVAPGEAGELSFATRLK